MSDDYWNAFLARVSFMEPKTIEGVVEWLDTEKTSAGVVPQMMIRLDSGQGVIVTVAQARLLEELTRRRPRIGDRIKIIYKGEAGKAPPGLSPTKEFDVRVSRKTDTPTEEKKVNG